MSQEEKVKVIVRCRPYTSKELSEKQHEVVLVEPEKGLVTVKNLQSNTTNAFLFDSVFDETCTQNTLYGMSAREIVDSVLMGYNGTIFAYGQTGTGKTYSMQGGMNNEDSWGIIPNSFQHIFSSIHHSPKDVQYLVRASYLELYNDHLRDLLNPTEKNLEIKQRKGIVVVDGKSMHDVRDSKELQNLMAKGDKVRCFGSTDMNQHSSRSHTIFTVTIEQSLMSDGHQDIKVGNLHLVDLAGSERQVKSKSIGLRFEEAKQINLALSALGNVIAALSDPKSSHVPFRDSKLTRLLQDSLGGNSKTLMLATISPSSSNLQETLSTLRYASRARKINNKPIINSNPDDPMLLSMQKQVKELKLQLLAEEELIKQQTDNLNNAKMELELAEIQSRLKQEKERIVSDLVVMEQEIQQLKELEVAREQELARSVKERQFLTAKLMDLQQKMITGDVSILDKHQLQQIELAKKAKKLASSIKRQQMLRDEVLKHDQMSANLLGANLSIQQQLEQTTKVIKQITDSYDAKFQELQDLKSEYRGEREIMCETIRALKAEIQNRQILIDAYIPKKFQQLIKEYTIKDEENQRISFKNAHLAGNKVIKPKEAHWNPSEFTASPFLSYSDFLKPVNRSPVNGQDRPEPRTQERT